MTLGIHSGARWSVLVTIALLLGSCSGAEPPVAEAPAVPTAVTSAAPDAAELTDGLAKLAGNATVEIVVDGSPITVEIDGDQAPYTAGNFVDLAEKGVYDGTVFHRVVRSPEPFVVQGGDPQSTDPNVPVSRLGTGSYIDPATSQPRLIPLEILPEGADQPVYGQTLPEAGVDAGPALTHRRGAVAMARSGVNTASAQFYITLADVTFLDGDYAVFGYVTDGMDVVDGIEAGAVIDSVTVAAGAENLVPAGNSGAAE